MQTTKSITSQSQLMSEQIRKLEHSILTYEEGFMPFLENLHQDYVQSGRNLIHYLALKNNNIDRLEDQLVNMGIAKLDTALANIIHSLSLTKKLLLNSHDHFGPPWDKPVVSIRMSKKLLAHHTRTLLGKKPTGRKSRIMVTLPVEAARDNKLVRNFIKKGMNIARINCAHDTPETWAAMIANIQEANLSLNKNCKIAMDLGGPKLRTGPVKKGPEVVHIKPARDSLGKIIEPALVWMAAPKSIPPVNAPVFVPASSGFIKSLRKGDKVEFKDTRGKNRHFEIIKKEGKGRWAYCYDSVYITNGTKLKRVRQNQAKSIPDKVCELKPIEETIILNKGDTLILTKNSAQGERAVYNSDGIIIQNAHISTTMPEIFDYVKTGEPVLFDDGKIVGEITEVLKDELHIRIHYVKSGGSKLKAEKGINLPDSDLKIKGLTEKDKKDLEFIAHHADMVNFSFVNNPEDVNDLLHELKKYNTEIGIILKIETKQAVRKLPLILLTAMQSCPVGVMIARGDLAIECGWMEMANIQEDILKICKAAHTPAIWATQVLENMAKKGLPSRAEITDAAMSQRADCVMLNKGAHITAAIKMLDKILKSI